MDNAMSLKYIKKRDGSQVEWDREKIKRAISLSLFSYYIGLENPDRDNPVNNYGLPEDLYNLADELSFYVESLVNYKFPYPKIPTVEDVQESVSSVFIIEGYPDVERIFNEYRKKRNSERIKKYSDSGIQNWVIVNKYMRYNPEKGRRETWEEACNRVFSMHDRKMQSSPRNSVDIEEISNKYHLSDIQKKILENNFTLESVYKGVLDKKILPAMRSLQFGGKAIEVHNARMFNCCFSPADRVEFFSECMYLLLCGCGVGFSVQKHHVEKLPTILKRGPEIELYVNHVHIDDSIEGWSDAVKELFNSYLFGYRVEFDYSKIRSRGTPLKTSGGRAPGHYQLKESLESIRKILQGANGRKLRPIEVYDITCFIAQAVLSGGVRRSALICLFSQDSDEMMCSKTGKWWEENRQRICSNNSVVLLKDEDNSESIEKIFKYIKEFGEPGFVFLKNKDFGVNPCCEVGINPYYVVTEEFHKEHPEYKVGDRVSGWGFCNLTTQNGLYCSTEEKFYETCVLSSALGTLQASYTDFDYLSPITKAMADRDSLIGVSICGVMDNPQILLDKRILREGANLVKATNELWSKYLGINRAQRCCSIKPEGTSSLVLGTASGCHPRWSKRYFRRVTCVNTDKLFQYFKKFNPHMVEKSVEREGDSKIVFPVESPETAVLREDLTAIQFLDAVKLLQENWVIPGTIENPNDEGLYHNVSNTVSVKDWEWEGCINYVKENQSVLTGVTFLSFVGDKVYKQAPLESVSSEEDIKKWNSLLCNPVDYSLFKEDSDYTELKENVACSGGQCELR